MSGSQDPQCSALLDRRALRRRRPSGMVLRRTALLAGALLLAGCGGSSGGDSDPGAAPTASTAPAPAAAKDLSLTLDFAPNAVHSGLYVAQERRLLERAGVSVTVRVPGSGVDGAKLLAAGRTDLAIMDIHDVALAREQGSDIVAVSAIVQRPLASVIADPRIERPRDLEGRSVGVTGLPSDDAALDEIVRGDGGRPQRVKRVEIGFEAVASVISGRVAAAIGFWNAEGVSLQKRRPGTNVFRLDEFGAPRYPELLLVATSRTLAERGAAVERLVAALNEGYRIAATSSSSSDGDVIRDLKAGSGDKTIDPATTSAQLAAIQPAFLDASGQAGTIDRETMRSWAAWEARTGIVKDPPDIDELVWDRAPGR